MNENIRIIENPSINGVKGFYANATCAGIKNMTKPDLAIVFSETPAVCFGMFTKNKFQAAPVIVTRNKLKRGVIKAIAVNSGNANACTGDQGINDAETMCSETAKMLGINPEDVAVASTGVIGINLPMDKITGGIKKLKDIITEQNEDAFSRAIMTTDTVKKISSVKVTTQEGAYTIYGTCKGSGMIHPDMATMLAFIFTDAKIELDTLSTSFKEAVAKSFNSVTIDGDTSTNDSAVIMANGESGVGIDESNIYLFKEALSYVTLELAKKITFDGEGSTKFIEIEVNNANSVEDAKKLAMTVAKSSLVKTAFFGEDANWGRIVCALGYSGVDFDCTKVDVSIGSLLLCKNGTNNPFSEEEAADILKKRDIKVTIDMKSGKDCWTVFTTDLSYEYVKINGSYRT